MGARHTYNHPRPSVAVDLILFSLIDGRLNVLSGLRAADPHKGKSSLPGTYVRESESAEDACARKIKAIGLAHTYLEQLYTFTEPARDPRERVVSIAYYGLTVAPHRLPAGDDKIDNLEWISPAAASRRPWAFDHKAIVSLAVERLRSKLQYTPVSAYFLHDPFTLFELCQVYSGILGHKVDLSNFRRDLLRQGLVIKVGTRRMRGPTATTYRWNRRNQQPFFLSLG